MTPSEPRVSLPSGFVDIHCHGALGFSFDDADGEGVETAVGFHRRNGTSHVVLSLVSAPIAQLVQRLQQLRDIVPTIPGVLGVHLEGPFLATSRRGAHSPDSLLAPTPKAVGDLLAAGEGILRQVTIAPELPGALDAVDAFVSAGVVTAVGHTNATRDVAAAAFDRGASLLTHAFNAMPGLHHREPGPVGAALDRDHVVLEAVADGHHLDGTVLRALFAAAPERVALVSDSIVATGLGDGDYQLGELAVEVQGGPPLLKGTGVLAGSTLTMRRAVEVAVAAGVPRSQAIAAATYVPARAIGLSVARAGAAPHVRSDRRRA